MLLHLTQTLGRARQVRVGHLREDGTGETRKLATHSGRAHKLALDPSAAAAFYSCGEDGVVCLLPHLFPKPDAKP